MASISSLAQSHIPILTGNNYEIWAIKMRTLLRYEDVWDVVYHELSAAERDELTAVEIEKKRKEDEKALYFIQNGLDDSVFPKISAAESSKEAWDILETNYKGTTKINTVKLQTLRMNFENLKMKESESLEEFMIQVMNIVSQLKMNGEKIPDHKVVQKVLRTLPKKFDAVVIAIEESKDLKQLSLDELLGSLLSHESRMHTSVDTLPAEVFVIICAGFVFRLLFGEVPSNLGLLSFIIEVVVMVLLIYVISKVASITITTDQLVAMAVGAVIGMIVAISGPIAGASLNPATSTGSAVAGSSISIYMVLGAILGAIYYDVIRTTSVPIPKVHVRSHV
jgi:hypothetical protein